MGNGAGAELIVATFNIRHGEGLDGRIDLERTARAILDTQAEFVALQELDRGRKRSGNVDQPAVLEELTGLRLRFWPTIGSEYGMAIASPEPVDAEFVALPRVAREEPRGVIVTHYGGIDVLATHLARGDEPRDLQTRALAELAKGRSGPATILGDMNQDRWGLRPVLETGFSPGPRHKTMVRWFRWAQLDHILLGPEVRRYDSWTIGSKASDHRPLAASIYAP